MPVSQAHGHQIWAVLWTLICTQSHVPVSQAHSHQSGVRVESECIRVVETLQVGFRVYQQLQAAFPQGSHSDPRQQNFLLIMILFCFHSSVRCSHSHSFVHAVSHSFRKLSTLNSSIHTSAADRHTRTHIGGNLLEPPGDPVLVQPGLDRPARDLAQLVCLTPVLVGALGHLVQALGIFRHHKRVLHAHKSCGWSVC